MPVVLFLIVWLGMIAVVMNAAKRREHAPLLWGALALFTGPLQSYCS